MLIRRVHVFKHTFNHRLSVVCCSLFVRVVCHSASQSIRRLVNQSVNQSLSQLAYLFIFMNRLLSCCACVFCLFNHGSVSRFLHVFIQLSKYVALPLSKMCLSVYLSIYLSISTHLSIHPSVCMRVYIYIYTTNCRYGHIEKMDIRSKVRWLHA